MKKVLITTALPYPNWPMHLWHVVWNHLPADIFYRFQKMLWNDVYIVWWTDDHGVAIEIAAQKYGTTEELIVKSFNRDYVDELTKISIEYDIFSWTHSSEHEEIAKQFFLNVDKNWFIEKRMQKQAYCNKCQKFLPDRYIEWTCPHCKTPGARWDQCETCGKLLDPVDLIDPVCKICGSMDIIQKDTYHYYFLLSKLQDKLQAWLDTKDEWKKNVIWTAFKWLNEWLEDRAISRDINRWIKIPNDETKKMYVWFEALLWYISFSKQLGDRLNRDILNEFWADPDAEIINFLGKDNIVFHTIIWPAILMADGRFQLPKYVCGNEFLNLEWKKFSTSRNFAVWLKEIVEAFDGDVIRYYLTYCIPERRDSNFSWDEFKEKNNELANILGNLVNRVITFSVNKFEWEFEKFDINTLWENAQSLLDNLWNTQMEFWQNLSNFRFRDGLVNVLTLIKDVNKYFNDSEPWVVAKTDAAKARNIINFCLYMLINIAILLQPYLPQTSKKILTAFGLENEVFWLNDVNNLSLPKNIKIKNIPILFKKLEEVDIALFKEKLWL